MSRFGNSVPYCRNRFGSVAIVLVFAMVATVGFAKPDKEMPETPGVKMSKTGTQKKRTAPRKRPKARRSMSGRKMPGTKMSRIHRIKHRGRTAKSSAKKTGMQNMLGMKMPGMNMPKSQASPAQPKPTEMNMPGMQMPTASPSPSSPRKMEMNMPMPSASPGASPEQKMEMNMPMPGASASPSPMKQMPGMETGAMNTGPLLVMSVVGMGVRIGPSKANVMNLGQMGSGTSWQPDSSPMHMMDKISGKWVLMLHYNAFLGVNSQGGLRGATKFESANWFMPMAFRRVGPGTLQLRGMFSAEPFTYARGGSPLLFQTGETFKGQPLVDRQHPHDLFMELSANYTVPLRERGTWFAYFAYPGEPALGPPAFMHRWSASENPSAPLSHHLQDSTHISFGVFTTGFTYRWFKWEGSIFNGQEPDENRYDFEAHPWSSRSLRFWFAPNKNWSMQVSHGFLKHPEALEPGDVRRTTASLSYGKQLHRVYWATSIIWGRNHLNSSDKTGNLNGYTAESTVNFLDKNYLYTRLELVDKDDLLSPAERARLGIKEAHPSFRIGAYTFGGARDLWDTDKVSLAIGSDLTFYSKPALLDQVYGNNPVSWRVFLRLRPSKMDMNKVHRVHGHTGEQHEPPTQ
jgi:hypothetical protein